MEGQGRGGPGEVKGEEKGRKEQGTEVPSHHTLPHSMSTESRAPWNTAWSHHVPCGAHGVQVIQLQSSSSGRSAGWLDLKLSLNTMNCISVDDTVLCHGQ